MYLTASAQGDLCSTGTSRRAGRGPDETHHTSHARQGTRLLPPWMLAPRRAARSKGISSGAVHRGGGRARQGAQSLFPADRRGSARESGREGGRKGETKAAPGPLRRASAAFLVFGPCRSAPEREGHCAAFGPDRACALPHSPPPPFRAWRPRSCRRCRVPPPSPPAAALLLSAEEEEEEEAAATPPPVPLPPFPPVSHREARGRAGSFPVSSPPGSRTAVYPALAAPPSLRQRAELPPPPPFPPPQPSPPALAAGRAPPSRLSSSPPPPPPPPARGPPGRRAAVRARGRLCKTPAGGGWRGGGGGSSRVSRPPPKVWGPPAGNFHALFPQAWRGRAGKGRLVAGGCVGAVWPAAGVVPVLGVCGERVSLLPPHPEPHGRGSLGTARCWSSGLVREDAAVRLAAGLRARRSSQISSR